MKYQQVSVDFVNMVFTAFSYLALAGAAWIFLRLLQACFWLPRHLRKQNDVQQMLQEKVDSYEKYLLECEENEKRLESGETVEDKEEKEGEKSDSKETTPLIPKDGRTNEERWKERRECLDMLKRELKRVQDGGDIYDWDYLLEEDDKLEEGASTSEVDDNDEDSKTKEKEKIADKDELSLKEIDCEILEKPTIQEGPAEEKKDK